MNAQKSYSPTGKWENLGTKRKQTGVMDAKGGGVSTTGCLAYNRRDKSLVFEQMFVHI